MSEDRADLILNIGPAIRAKQDQHDQKFDEAITRLSALGRDFAGMKLDFAGVHARLDNAGRRLDRVERRSNWSTSLLLEGWLKAGQTSSLFRSSRRRLERVAPLASAVLAYKAAAGFVVLSAATHTAEPILAGRHRPQRLPA
jgi:hypothetical protein